MNEGTLLVDPLAALFRPALARCAPLILDTTHVEVMLLPPLAHIAVARTFTNSSDQLVEAVLTLPPAAPQEIIYRLIVNIGGVDYHGSPQPGNRARRAHDAAVAEGRRAILYELLRNEVQLISIAGIEPGMRVEVQLWSVRPLARPDAGRATLSIPLSAGPDFPMSGLSDADAPVTVAARHAATLSVNVEALRVTLHDPDGPRQAIVSRAPVDIDCAAPILLDIVPHDDGNLDHSAWQVDEAGGWEVTSARGFETFRHPMNPGGSVISDRSDWIFGAMATADGEIRVTAPLPTEGIAPNARAMRAFAAAGFVESAMPVDTDFVRRTANVLSRQTSLAFIGPAGVLPDEVPMLQKLALPEMLAPDLERAPPQPVAMEPLSFETPPEPEPLPPYPDERPIAPGARPPRHHWLTWGPIALVLLWIAAAIRLIDMPLVPMALAFGLTILSAIRFLPREGSPAWRRLPLLAVLGLPWIASYFGGPLSSDLTYGGGSTTGDWMIPFQYGLLAASAALPFALMPVMRDARRFTLVFGVLNLALTFFATSDSILILTPGS